MSSYGAVIERQSSFDVSQVLMLSNIIQILTNLISLFHSIRSPLPLISCESHAEGATIVKSAKSLLITVQIIIREIFQKLNT